MTTYQNFPLQISKKKKLLCMLLIDAIQNFLILIYQKDPNSQLPHILFTASSAQQNQHALRRFQFYLAMCL